MRVAASAAVLLLAASAQAQDITCRYEALGGGAFRLTCPAPSTVSTPPLPTATATPAPPTPVPPAATATPNAGCPQFLGGNSPLLCPTYDLMRATWGAAADCFGKYEQLNGILRNVNRWAPQQTVRAFQNYLRFRTFCAAFGAGSHEGGESVLSALRQYPDGRCPTDPTRRAACLERWQTELRPLLNGVGAPAGAP